MSESSCGARKVLFGNRIGCIRKIFGKLLESEVIEGFETVDWRWVSCVERGTEGSAFFVTNVPLEKCCCEQRTAWV